MEQPLALERGLTDLLVVWTLLASQVALAPPLGVECATGLAFAASGAFALARVWRDLSRPAIEVAWQLALGVLAGYALQPAAVGLVAATGLALGLAPTRTLDNTGGAIAKLCRVVLAPLFEEIVYRQRLLLPLVPRIGRAAAVGLTSVLFALPHVHAWAVLGTFLVGLALGGLRLAGGSLALCVGVHAGLNARALDP